MMLKFQKRLKHLPQLKSKKLQRVNKSTKEILINLRVPHQETTKTQTTKVVKDKETRHLEVRSPPKTKLELRLRVRLKTTSDMPSEF